MGFALRGVGGVGGLFSLFSERDFTGNKEYYCPSGATGVSHLSRLLT